MLGVYDEFNEGGTMIQQLLSHLTPPLQDPENKKPPLHLYGIFNAEKYKNLWIKLECEWKFKHASLFTDEALEVSMNSVAPYLVYIPITHPRVTTLLKHYGHGGTLFFLSEEGFAKVLERMKSLFEIRSEDGDKGYLAFYRPDHFSEIMKSNSPIKNTLFTKTDTWFCENELETKILYKYSMNAHQVTQENIKFKGEEL
jgi:hypothetical protein